ncbi:MAG: c-type cytochrome [Chloroflexi bacterium]|nr:c-type cytochrome [Chloroflexota bacterium]
MSNRLARARSLALIFSLIVLAGLAVRSAAAQTEGDPQRGGELFSANCAVCHGSDGRGRIGADLNQFPGINVDAFLRETIAQGVAGSVMPAWGQANGGLLSEQDINDIAAYIVGVFGGTEPIAPAPTYAPVVIPPLPNVQADVNAGAQVFQQNCVVCHGERGQGRVGAILAKSWAAPIPDARIRVTVRDGIAGSKMPAWGQASGGPLSDEDINNVAAYVLTLQPVEGAATTVAPPGGPISRTTGLLLLGLVGVLIVAGLVVYYRRA